MTNLVADTAMVATGDEASRWAAYSGRYRMPAWGYLDLSGPPDRFVVDAGVPYFETDDNADAPVRHPLTEVEPGLFLADNGETLDFRGRVPTWRNFRLVRVSGGPSTWQWGILGAAALIAVIWLVAAPVRSVRRSRDSRSGVGGSADHDAPLAPGYGAGGECDRTAHARKRGPARVAPRARRHWIRRPPRPFPGRADGGTPAAGRNRPRRLDGGSRRFGLDRTLVVERRKAAIRRPCCRGDRARPAPRWMASHRVGHELRFG